jgi:hypothetical protein
VRASTPAGSFPPPVAFADTFACWGCDLTRERTLWKRREQSSSRRRVGRSTRSAHAFPAARGGCLLPPSRVDRLILDARLGCKIKANFCVVSAVTSHQLKETCHRQPRFLGRRSTCVWWLLWTGIEIRPKCISIVGDSFAKKNSRRFFREEATWQSIFPLTPWYYQRTATISPNVTTNQLRLTHNCLSIHNPNSLELQYITVLVGHYKERIILIVRGTTQEYTFCKCSIL